MKTSLKLSAYGAALAVLVAGTYAVGTAVGPVSDSSPSVTAPAHVDDHGAAAAAHEPGGLASTSGGYTLVPDATTLGSGTFAFRITGRDGAPVTAFDEAHERQLHLIVVRRDGTGFQHLHPERDAAGTWQVPLTVPAGGVYRAFADFTPTGGPATTLGVDLFAPGDFQPVTHAREPHEHRRRLHRDPRRRPHARRRVAAAADRHARRRTRRRWSPISARTATSSPCAAATWPTCTCTPGARRRPGPWSGSTPRCPAPGPTGCSSTSRSAASCGPPTSP